MLIEIDRPKGHVKCFQTTQGQKYLAYPVDYGFVIGAGLNPDDGEEPDVFKGSGGTICGRFEKGRPDGRGGWEFDERKWFVDLTGEEYTELFAWWHNDHDEGCTWDWVAMTRDEVLRDMIERAAAGL